jgi:hypothetical protein
MGLIGFVAKGLKIDSYEKRAISSLKAKLKTTLGFFVTLLKKSILL